MSSHPHYTTATRTCPECGGEPWKDGTMAGICTACVDGRVSVPTTEACPTCGGGCHDCETGRPHYCPQPDCSADCTDGRVPAPWAPVLTGDKLILPDGHRAEVSDDLMFVDSDGIVWPVGFAITEGRPDTHTLTLDLDHTDGWPAWRVAALQEANDG